MIEAPIVIIYRLAVENKKYFRANRLLSYDESPAKRARMRPRRSLEKSLMITTKSLMLRVTFSPRLLFLQLLKSIDEALFVEMRFVFVVFCLRCK